MIAAQGRSARSRTLGRVTALGLATYGPSLMPRDSAICMAPARSMRGLVTPRLSRFPWLVRNSATVSYAHGCEVVVRKGKAALW